MNSPATSLRFVVQCPPDILGVAGAVTLGIPARSAHLSESCSGGWTCARTRPRLVGTQALLAHKQPDQLMECHPLRVVGVLARVLMRLVHALCFPSLAGEFGCEHVTDMAELDAEDFGEIGIDEAGQGRIQRYFARHPAVVARSGAQ